MRVTGRMIAGVAAAGVLAVSAWVAVGTETPQTTPTTATTVSSTSVASPTTASSTTASSTTVAPSTTVATGLSRAWVESQEQLGRVRGTSFDEAGMVRAMAAVDYSLSNPNEWTTPVGALCWADFEINRTLDMAYDRETLDHDLIPRVIEALRIGDQVPSDLGPATSRSVIAILESYATTTTTASTAANPGGWFATSEFLNIVRLLDRMGGTGTELLDALDAVASPEWAAAIRAGDGLPADVLTYADGLAANAREALLSSQPRLTIYESGARVDGYWAFVELAKYDPNCLRARIGDPPPPLPDIPGLTTTTTEVGATTTTVRSGPVRVSGAGLDGVLRLGAAGVGVGYSRPGGEGSLTDTTFRHGGVGYEVERLLWWPNGTVRLDVYPGGLHTAVGDDAFLVITPGENDNPVEYAWDTTDARYLGDGADFVWDTEWEPEVGTAYRVELRIGVPGVPTNVTLSGTTLSWDAPSPGPAAERYHLSLRPLDPGSGTDSFLDVPSPASDEQASLELGRMMRSLGEQFVVQIRAYNDAGYSPWTEIAVFSNPTAANTTS